MKAEIAIYLLIAAGSMLMITFIPHMLLDGLVSNELKESITWGVSILWAIGLIALGVDIVKKRTGLKE